MNPSRENHFQNDYALTYEKQKNQNSNGEHRVATIDQSSLEPRITRYNISDRLIRAHYEIRGKIPQRAEALAKELRDNPKNITLPFKRIIACNLGNPQAVAQPPVTWCRQVLAALEIIDAYKSRPASMNNDSNNQRIKEILLVNFPNDVRQRAQTLSDQIGFLGAYTATKGVLAIRQAVSKFIEARDGPHLGSVDPEAIFLTNGASEGINRIIELVVGLKGQSSGSVGVLIPVPTYPLYLAALTMTGAEGIPYFLDEDSNWSLARHELERAINDARARSIDLRAMVLINPGNPTGSVLDRKTLEMIVETCARERLVLLADEVYQTNIFEPQSKPFISARKIAIEMESKLEDYPALQLFSFHSTSKGLLGECSRRGGYFQCHGILDQQVMLSILKLSSFHLSSNLIGQVMVSLMVEGPKMGEESYEQWTNELHELHESMKRRRDLMWKCFSSLPGIHIQPPEGAMYLFPRLHLPERFIEHAKFLQTHPEDLYCMQLLESTGICLVPGWGFGESLGTFHIRCTILPPEEQMCEFAELLGKWHREFYSHWSSNVKNYKTV